MLCLIYTISVFFSLHSFWIEARNHSKLLQIYIFTDFALSDAFDLNTFHQQIAQSFHYSKNILLEILSKTKQFQAFFGLLSGRPPLFFFCFSIGTINAQWLSLCTFWISHKNADLEVLQSKRSKYKVDTMFGCSCSVETKLEQRLSQW